MGIDDNFFEIGGHSLKATIMISRLHKIFNVKIPLTDIFQGPTIEKLAAKLKETVPHHFYTIPAAEKREYYPLSPAMKRLYLEQQMDSRSIAYNISSIVVLKGVLEKDRLNEAFRKLLRRQETLRTSFQWVKGEPVQKVHDNVEFELEYDESGNQQQAIVNRLYRPFDFTRPPLFCASLVKTGAREHLLMVSIHHSVADGTSIGILLSQFMALYNKERLPGLRIQYKDFSLWKHRQHLVNREPMESRETYWLEQFRGPIPVLNLPCDYPRPAQRSFEGGVVESRLEAETAKKLKALALAGDVTLYILGLSLFNILMMKLSGQEDIVVGTPTAGRDHADLEPLIGMFVNTLALRNYPVGSKRFKDFLQEVKERTLQAFAHQDYGFETLVKRVTVERDPGRSPIFDVFFAVQNMERPDFQVPGLRLRPYEYEGNISRFDLCFHVFEEGTQLLLVLDYCTRLFKRETVELFFKNFNEITAAILENPEILLQEIEISIEARKAEPAVPRVDLGF